MLMLSFDVRLGPGRGGLPPHLGGVLHGFVEGAALARAPHLLSVFRPGGSNDAARFVIHVPPAGSAIVEDLRFGLILFGDAIQAWAVLVRALVEQTTQRIHGRASRIESAWMQQPGFDPVPVIDGGRLIESVPELVSPGAWLRRAQNLFPAAQGVRVHALTFRSPLLLASRGAVRERLPETGQLPWPPLGSVLASIARRLHVLEPELAKALDVGAKWRANTSAAKTEPFTPAAEPAKQVVWTYTAAAREHQGQERSSSRRSLPIPGIVGTLLYPASDDPTEHALLNWGQWLGVGQKTTMGCGNYALNSS